METISQKRELESGLKWKVGHIVVDNFYELEILDKMAQSKRKLKQDILLRITARSRSAYSPVHVNRYNR